MAEGDPDEAPDRPARLTPAERAQQKREEKLAEMQEQVDSGRLVIRQMSDEERAEWAKRRAERGDPPPRRRGR